MIEELSFLTEFAFEILIVVVLGTGGSILAYFKHLHMKIAIVDDRSLRLSTAFLHFVKRNDELHIKEGTPTISLGDEIENLLKDPKTGQL